MPKSKIRLIAQKLDGKPFVRDLQNQQEFEKFQAQAPAGCYVLEIHKAKKYKTNQQTKTHFGLLINSVIAQANDDGVDTSNFLKLLLQDDLPTGVGLTADFLHQLFYACCPTVNSEGKRITLSKMNTIEASDWFERCRNLLASRGFYVNDPDPNWREKLEKGKQDGKF